MIKLSHLEKYFNQGKSNEIHVLNNVSMTLPEKGLVVLLGPSGSGKTTLLNVIGGLDKVSSGEILFDNEMIKKYDAGRWDEIRNTSVGYIFQNYYLLPQLSVFDNVAFVLKMIGIEDGIEIKERVEYILKAVGMYKYRKKKALQLSGGQQQRVAIARALVKNPKVIIADEPTGNLDSKNTIEVMNIIKSISKNTLVVLVTHEKDLAYYYGNVIYEFKDGRIIHENREHDGSAYKLNSRDQAIYLKDFKTQKIMSQDDITVKYYGENPEPMEIKLIVRNDTLYIDTQTKFKKIRMVDETSNMMIKDEHYKESSRESVLETSFDVHRLDHSKLHKKPQMMVSIKHTLWMAFKKVIGFGKKGKLMLFGFAFGGIVVAFGLANLLTIFLSTPDRFMTRSDNYLILENRPASYETFKAAIGHDNYLLSPQSSVNIQITASNSTFDLGHAYIEYQAHIAQDDLIYGRLAENDYEINISQGTYENDSFSLQNFHSLGIWKLEDLLDETILLRNTMSYKVVGITKQKTKTIYFNSPKSYIFSLIEQPSIGYQYSVLENGDVTVDLRMNASYQYTFNYLNQPVASYKIEPLSTDHTGSGIYVLTIDASESLAKDIKRHLENHGSYDNFLDITYTNLADFEIFDYNEYIYQTSFGTMIAIYSKTNQAIFDNLSNNYDIYLSSFYAIKENEAYKNAEIGANLVVQLVLLAGVSIGFYFLMRSTMFSRVYEISVYRALGVRKKEILFSFMLEIIVLITCSYLIGYLLATWFIHSLTTSVVGVLFTFTITPYSILLGILIIYAVNILIGILPMVLLLRKTPAQILTQYDI